SPKIRREGVVSDDFGLPPAQYARVGTPPRRRSATPWPGLRYVRLTASAANAIAFDEMYARRPLARPATPPRVKEVRAAVRTRFCASR
ncbi:MAG: hypothetical protein AAF928_21020, partial [Myxococcota bacterium]